MTQRWTMEALPALDGRVAVITGANSGIGFETARALARRGARVVLACRDTEKALVAVRQVGLEAPQKDAVSSLPLDLASLASVRAFADAFRARSSRLDVLIHNAGVMATPERHTAEGFELQLGTNHLGHFALAGLLLDVLLATPGSRVVTVSSAAHRIGRIDFDNLQSERRYRPWQAYGQSKLANLLYTFELQRRLDRYGADMIAVAAHPGYSATQLQARGPSDRNAAVMTRLVAIGNRFLAQSAAMGALPTLFAATAPTVRGGDYFGPDRWFEMRGHPRPVGTAAAARDEQVAARLWRISEELTGVRYAALG
ncbi:SDR family oxidoreductase [Myxococcota bacterium]|nr:SDR family oxidoreductase [Myxococcota bacterium]MCZ7619363.1 oxidoreductase [Myxococcota bacterium]